MRNRIFFDTEFIEDGKTIELISIGLVREELLLSGDIDAIYLESSECDLTKANEWVQANVFPYLSRGSSLRTRQQIRDEILEWAGPYPEFWADYGAYDWVVLCQLFGTMINLPGGWPMYCRDLQQLLDWRNETPNSGIPNPAAHNAISDACWVRNQYLWITSCG